jgi:hypothetical protein
MSGISTPTHPESGGDLPPAAPETTPAAVEFHYSQTDSFVALLRQLGASLLVTTYQANKLLLARAAGDGLSLLVRTFERPMGLAVDAQRLTIGTRIQIWFLRNAPDIASRVEPAGHHDACFVPRSSHVTGDIGVHEMAWAGDELWVIRPTSAMDGVPLAERRAQLKCGVAAVDLRSGDVIAFLEFQTAVEEIFDVQLLPGFQFPEVVGFQKETIHHMFIVPPQSLLSAQRSARSKCRTPPQF